jgi:hypothetical protein
LFDYRFPYRLWYGIRSPFATIRLFYDKTSATAEAYVDSGAFYSIFGPVVAASLGLTITAGTRKRVRLADGRMITVYLHRMGFGLGEEHFTATIGFSDELGIGFNLLGRFSIFDRLMFCFNDHEGTLYVSRIEGEHEG